MCYARAVEALAALADPTRRELVALLAAGELAAGDLARRFPVSRPAAAAGARRVAGALSRPVGPAARRPGHRDRPRPAGGSERRTPMTEDLDSRRGVVTP